MYICIYVLYINIYIIYIYIFIYIIYTYILFIIIYILNIRRHNYIRLKPSRLWSLVSWPVPLVSTPKLLGIGEHHHPKDDNTKNLKPTRNGCSRQRTIHTFNGDDFALQVVRGISTTNSPWSGDISSTLVIPCANPRASWVKGLTR